ncbi:hypothetical protein TBLA_0C06910 [Henningerozyma blattae CBS 6284]|uniref:serine C-palmitoyltransferase n=1 Tax=Henningerozyma blattae (strain ATCC 34711 / CBS 6284 / DSM 70876 / NBRC 10599 / NRRL Y-10934 / UCD 77-7) TaxID=1071380 RepID=I2H281_HENB6|nr:hypothetical protein TBLA_0C06910 [Tetrapisispora blattae CBS 6284]CCH60483.1 hypothetical protein TBLA_0C06910 [Tetrapisispora blattae CBS 6284]
MVAAASIDAVASTLPNSIPVPVPHFIAKLGCQLSSLLTLLLIHIPGGTQLLTYIKKSIHDDPYRAAVEIGLIVYGILYWLAKPKRTKKSYILNDSKLLLSEREINDLIEDWEPEPLVDASILEEQRWRLQSIPVIDTVTDDTKSLKQPFINISRDDNKEFYKNVLNLTSHNFLQISSLPQVLDVAKQTVENYGVGACGPAGFYGNQDAHYTTEYKLAEFFGTEGAVLYGQDFCVAASVIPAFTKRGDLIVADDQVSLSIQNALQLSRSTIYYFKHNDMESLENLLIELNESEKLEKLPAIPRKFIVTEGLFHNSGDLAPLPQLTRLKNKYKFRLFVDETFSLGVLGKTGRGLSEHFNMDRSSSIDITVGSMATAFGSSGGFVLGDHIMTFHQHIGSNAYCFSASLPAYTVLTLTKVLEIMDQDNSAVNKVQVLSKMLHDFFITDDQLSKFVEVTSDEQSPVLHFRLNQSFRDLIFHYSMDSLFETIIKFQQKNSTTRFIENFENEEKFLQKIVDKALIKHNILISRNTIVMKHESLPCLPSLKICVNANISEKILVDALANIKESILHCCQELVPKN